MTFERHHARTHQAVLQFCRNPRLLNEQAVRLGRQRRQRVFEAAEVIGRLRQRPRQLLDVRVTVELERVEVSRHQRVLVAVHDLRLGLDLELAQLLA